jgi:adenine phosphoribosyltransferase
MSSSSSQSSASIDAAKGASSEREEIRSSIRTIPDFPRPGLTMLDLTSILSNPPMFARTISILVNRFESQGLTHICACESFGFIIASPVAVALKLPFIPIRRAHKLPGDVVSISVQYSTHSRNSLELHKDSFKAGDRILLLDDVIGTGRTLLGAAELIKSLGAEVVALAVLAEVPGLTGRHFLEEKGYKVFSVC